MKYLSALIALFMLFTCSMSYCQTRAAVMYSSAGNSQYKNEQTEVLSSLGWSQDLYANTQANELAVKLGNYDVVILNTLFNLEKTQDLSTFGAKLRDFVISGGCLVVTDANYTVQTLWLRTIDPGLIWRVSGKMSNAEGLPAPWVNSSHPLMAGIDTPKLAWTFPDYTGAGLQILAKYPNGRPAVGVMELGKGIIVVSNPYRQQGWPSAVFLKNLLKWVKDPVRINAVSERDAVVKHRGENPPALNVPVLTNAPRIDGSFSAEEWKEAAVIQELYDMKGGDGCSQHTKVSVGRYKDNLYVLFDCSDTDVAGIVKGITERDGSFWTNDSVEIFLDPTGERKSYYQFGIGCSGAMFDARGTDTTWNTFWKARTSIGENGWIAEVSIPFASLGDDALLSKGTWAANFCRTIRPQNDLERENTNWASTFGFFRQPERFGTLTGMAADSEKHSFKPDIALELPKLWFADMKQFAAVVSCFPGKSGKGILELIDVAADRSVWAKSIMVKKGGTCRVGVDYRINPSQTTPLQVILRDSDNMDEIAAFSNTFVPVPAPDLSIRMIKPAFRANIQSKDPEKKLLAECTVGTDLHSGMYLNCSVRNDSGKEMLSMHKPANTHKNVRFEADLSRLPAGQYKINFDLADKSGSITSRNIPLIVAPPAKTEVTFNSTGTCYVNGKPFFPIGLYHVSPAAISAINQASAKVGIPAVDLYQIMKEVKARGFNVIHHTWGMPTEEYLKEAESDGLMVLPEVAAPTAEQVALADKFSNVLMWYGSDEPAGERLTWIKNAFAQTSKLDPHRPVSAAVANFELFKPALEGFDFVMMDPYFIGMKVMHEIANWIEKGHEASNNMKAVWLVPQSFAIGSTIWSEPTPEELRCQAYIGLVHGVKGFVWYALWSPEFFAGNARGRNLWFLPDTVLWDYFPKLNTEISDMSDVYLTGKSLGPVNCTSKSIHTNLWKMKGKTYVVAVNTAYEPVDCELGGFGRGTVDVKFESRKVIPARGKLHEHFKALEAHVYEY